MTYDFEHTDESTAISYRVRGKTFSVRDSLNCSNEQDAITAEYEGRTLIECFSYPVLKYGTDVAEFSVDGKNWQPIPMNELEDFLNLPEFVMFGWRQSIYERNPHRYNLYENLKNSVAAVVLPTNTPPTSENTNGVTETPPAYAN